MIIRFHFNKQRASKGLPWTLHTSKACLSAAHVVFKGVRLETEEKPERKTNPRYFLKCKGSIEWDGDVAVIVKEK
jgi:hypothetical protein